MENEEYIRKLASLEDRIAGLREANEELLVQLQAKDVELLRLRRDLQERLAEAIWRENDIQRNQERFRSLVANLPGAVYRCSNDAFWTMEYLSDQIEQLSGYPAADFIQNCARSYKSIVHPEDVIKVVNAISQGVEQKRPYTIIYRIRHKNGTYRTVHERGIGIHASDGTLLWLDGVIFDISGHENGLVDWPAPQYSDQL
ncbi:MAG: PAS domain-containing protein [Bacteroidia bacterium]|nr:PAS domain-containing protein [Bacteroidia bacterium]